MKMYESIGFPIGFTTQYQTERDRAFYAKQLAKAKRKERSVLKAGLTYVSSRISNVCDIRYEMRFYRDVERSRQFADAVLDGLLTGRIKL